MSETIHTDWRKLPDEIDFVGSTGTETWTSGRGGHGLRDDQVTVSKLTDKTDGTIHADIYVLPDWFLGLIEFWGNARTEALLRDLQGMLHRYEKKVT